MRTLLHTFAVIYYYYRNCLFCKLIPSWILDSDIYHFHVTKLMISPTHIFFRDCVVCSWHCIYRSNNINFCLMMLFQGPFDAIRKLLSFESQKLSVIDKSDLFFCDYSIMPLFVQENYLSVRPSKSE